jgi:proteasome lid subunit RPN8/RPN11
MTPDHQLLVAGDELVARLAGVRHDVEADQHALATILHHAIISPTGGDVEELARRLHLTARTLSVLTALTPQTTAGVVEYWLSTRLLRESCAACTGDDAESLHLLTGFRVGNTAVPLAVEVPTLASRGRAHAKATHESTHHATIRAVLDGHCVLGILHNHPGKGAAATHPSHEDLHTQRLWEHTGFVLGGIWTRDGYVRFFTAKQDYAIRIAGEGVDHVEGSLYHLTNAA